jgi:hypothetical protein
VVFSGLLVRMRDEAQLARVLATGGPFPFAPSYPRWRDLRRKSDIFQRSHDGSRCWSAPQPAFTSAMRRSWHNSEPCCRYSLPRKLEAEADAMGLKLIAEAGYDPMAMPEVWSKLLGRSKRAPMMRMETIPIEGVRFCDHPAPIEDGRSAGLSGRDAGCFRAPGAGP